MTLSRIAAFMTDPASYPHRPPSVEMVETHISLVFIAGHLVYKIKKPVNFGFLDFTTLEKRAFFCREEIRLNRRLAEDIYLDVVPIHQDETGTLNFLDRGEAVEYAVLMKRIPEDRMLGTLLEKNIARKRDMETLAGRICAFHDGAATGGEIDEIGGFETIRKNHEENFEQTESYVGTTISRPEFEFIRSWALGFLENREALFRRRVATHKIRECHGDLHLQHICFINGIVVFDCIEFNKRFRYLDRAAEVAFLSMDLDFHGYGDYGDAFVRAYIEESGDEEINTLLPFYKCYFAYVRGKVTGFRLQEPGLGGKEKDRVTAEAGKYFRLAYRCAARLDRPALLVMSGWMGTGKSFLAAALAPLIGAGVIRMDVLRKELSRISTAEHRYEDFGEGIYGEEMNRRTYEAAFEKAGKRLGEGKPVILDGSFRDRRDRAAAMAVARSHGADFFAVHCVCPDDVLRQRLEKRERKGTDVSDGRLALLDAQKKAFHPLEDVPGENLITIDTSGSLEGMVAKILSRIRLGR